MFRKREIARSLFPWVWAIFPGCSLDYLLHKCTSNQGSDSFVQFSSGDWRKMQSEFGAITSLMLPSLSLFTRRKHTEDQCLRQEIASSKNLNKLFSLHFILFVVIFHLWSTFVFQLLILYPLCETSNIFYFPFLYFILKIYEDKKQSRIT